MLKANKALGEGKYVHELKPQGSAIGQDHPTLTNNARPAARPANEGGQGGGYRPGRKTAKRRSR
ncbi:hypothetical protein EP7_001382 [Isosphaeraceae bacterium EP7]